MASLVDQIFMQADAGSANGQSMIAPMIAGAQLAQSKQRINLEQQQLAAELAQLPLKQTLLQQSVQMNGLKLTDFLEQRQAIVQNEAAYQETTNLVAQALASQNPEDAESYVWDAISRNRGLWRHPGIKPLLEDARASLAGKIQIQQLKNDARVSASTFEPSMTVVVDPITGEKKSVFKSSPNSAQLVKEAGAENTSATTNFTKLSQLQDALDIATRSGDAAAITKAKRDLDTFQALAVPASESMTFNPTTGEVRVERGRNLSQPTMANQTKIQQSLSDSLQTIDTANRLEPLISTETVGVQAFAESWIKDRLLAQRFPELASQKRANAEALAAQLKASAVRELKTDSNITERERKQILDAVPDINSPIDSPARAKQLVKSVRALSAIHAVVAASKLKVPIPRPAALALTADDLKGFIAAGVITKEQAAEAYAAKFNAE